MLRLVLRRSDAPAYQTTVIGFPAHEDALERALVSIGVGICTEKNCLVEELSGDGGALQHLVGQSINADEMQFLAKRLDSLSDYERQIFRGATHAEQLNTVKDMINLTFNTHAYTIVSDFSDLAEIGRHHELNRRLGMSTTEMQQIDFSAIGQALLSEGTGKITPFGVLYRNGNEQQEIYNGEQFPEYHHIDDIATVTLEVGDYHSGIKQEYLYLPCCAVEIQKALCRLGVDNLAPCATTLDCAYMSDEIHRIFTEDFPLSEHIDTLNSLTRSYVGFSEDNAAAFHAIVDLVHPRTPEDVVVLAQNFYEFTAVPNVHTVEELGQYEAKHSAFYDLNDRLLKYVDLNRYAEDLIREQNGCFTEFGYVGYRGATPAVAELLSAGQQQTNEPTNGLQMGGMST